MKKSSIPRISSIPIPAYPAYPTYSMEVPQ